MDTKFTPEEASGYLDVEVRTLQNWRRDKAGPAYHKPTNKLVYYFKSDLDNWIKGENNE